MGSSWSTLLLAVALFVVTSLGSLWVAGLVLVRLPADHFLDPERRNPRATRHPVWRVVILVLRNLAGGALVALGVFLSIPGIPGQGILTILVGLLLVDFPGKLRFLRWLLLRPRIRGLVDRLRQGHGKPPFELG